MLPHVHIAAFKTRLEAMSARRALKRDTDATVETRPVIDRPADLAELAARRPFVRSRSLRATGVGLGAGVLLAGVIVLAARAAGFVADLGILLLGVGLLAAMAGGLLGWLFGSATVNWRWERLMRACPDAGAFLAVRVHDERDREAFVHACHKYGALATASS